MSDLTHVCLAEKNDLQGVDALEQRCFHDHSYPDFFFRQALDCWPAGFLVAKDNSANVVGYLLATSGAEPHLCWLLSLAVCDKQRGKGIGRKLISHLLAHLPAGVTQLQLTVAPDNGAQSLYLKLGFIQTGFESDYFGEGEARLLMSYFKPEQISSHVF
ncbi:GNAT family N-acetyltransferase [Shewanella sp. D64]|uniref:GNAT family N-acetyltransferase n=1 Tax=unclassified Shewanella TaxID=196818 RepID=UPI0022BA5366|nr:MULTISPECIES: N-acetyltransferase [unclassified Shewanella]MEC4726184.1 GNAT family N-acetyltransferase [Shewanella sp. D64]MEC4738196.1 GNAT family N-acetyltransferase [Shewanella sp. E94]WBJ95340.1 GNAT family N-acetyltransferase [Shewanella sp. MTB7]